mmetsp:Transcript_10758/g.19506  ORF Transcript_10758/g.19506 Transcript_10758/m.19506 type:complete len:390 (-) Transcript_10758:412-1581(-)|eukprot:CAMPEP_0201889888 /NCGR_PEP_ID=MMETSP0902-20130614/31084_1 /ASSEMBLY_ACC=CAM_ASM_000551 /TAXON_ID=420261 /ORGANISM="Thalassiosira antarctica, Strain CCMP982" /LENGTH=389 /DNA_ID=CAMNT_0048420603 /DNA_START=239 /DNA_END=1408 /DNA_ORIENTATION=-
MSSDLSALPDPIPVGAPQAPAAAAPPAAANGTTNAHASAMHLFAPDPNGGENEPLDLDELFHDCYFGDFGVPEDVTSESAMAIPAPIPIAAPAAPITAKRTADQAGLNTTTIPAPASAVAPAQAAKPAPIPSPIGSDDGMGVSTKPAASLTESQKIERRERNREHAKRSRLRKKFLLESLQEQIDGLQSEIHTLKDIIKRELPDRASELLKDLGDGEGEKDDPSQPKKGSYTPLPMPSGFGPVKTLMEPDYRLMSALSGSQQNFAISDPSLPDNPIVYVSQGFLELTGYTLDQVLGRNCRFLQGPGTDQAAVDVIRRGVREGTDTSVCLLNYKADGTPFWNQFFVAALRDAENNVVNFVGVQCEVSKAVVEKHIKEGKTPESSMPAAGT